MAMKRKHRPFNNIERGDIYLADLGTEDKIVGSEQCGVRPVIVTQCDYNNRKSPTIIVAAVTSEIKKEKMDYHVILPSLKGLPRRSMVCAEQRRTIDRSRLIKYYCTVDEETMEKVYRACKKAEGAERKRRKWRKTICPRNW